MQVRHLLDQMGWRDVKGRLSVGNWEGLIKIAGHCHRIASADG